MAGVVDALGPGVVALPCAGVTAYHALTRHLRLAAGQTILITAGAGGVGGYAV